MKVIPLVGALKKLPIAPNGIFWTIQGEGALAGEPMAFVRLAGCSVGCEKCDTDYRVDRRLTVEEIVEEVFAVVPDEFLKPWVWITGGEPTDHNIGPLADCLKTVGFSVALATSGVRPVDPALGINWISVSPHSPVIAQRHGHELKVVPGLNGLDWSVIEQEIARWSFPYRFIQPMWDNGGPCDLDRCIEFVLSHPGWRLTSQAHKSWRLP